MRTRLVVLVVLAVALLGACRPIGPPGGTDPDAVTQSELQRALAAEKVAYASVSMYSGDYHDLRTIDTTIDWGGRVNVLVGSVHAPGDGGVVCLYERSASGTIFAIADYAFGQWAGTYYSRATCPGQIGDWLPPGFTDAGW